ncbi:protein maelstrom isoform X1 [Euwallacea fornicatus]|uniref:protein maelstrom isoform X1 n=1 Tax=Euwallacea fornicatus TaxID=995702 RepID=UPI00338ED186
MAPKKHGKANAFILFSQELMSSPGRKYNNLKDAIAAAGPLWTQMSKDQKRPYEERARSLKGGQPKLTCDGRRVDELTHEMHLKQEAESNARQEIRNLLTLAHTRNELATGTFFLVHCNIFCYLGAEDRFWPAEIALLAFDLKDGVKPENVFHRMVQPGPLPIGYKFDAKKHSEETHLISIPFDDDKSNMETIYYELKLFIEKSKPQGSKNMPILYAHKTYSKVVQNILNTWAADYEDAPNMFKVYDLQVMLYFLRNIVADDQVWPSLTFSNRELEKDIYAYEPGIACKYHSSSNSHPVYCSKSLVHRYAYVICDNCCTDLNIELISGQHVPKESRVPKAASSHDGFSSRSSLSSRHSRKQYDSEFDSDANSEVWETESNTSSVFSVNSLTSNFDENFPSLDRRATSSNTSGQRSGFAQSYVGAVNPSLSNSFENDFSELSLSQGRGTRKLASGSASQTLPEEAENVSTLDFPALGTGRGVRRPQWRKLGSHGGQE